MSKRVEKKNPLWQVAGVSHATGSGGSPLNLFLLRFMVAFNCCFHSSPALRASDITLSENRASLSLTFYL
jgi:hypothetical protein